MSWFDALAPSAEATPPAAFPQDYRLVVETVSVGEQQSTLRVAAHSNDREVAAMRVIRVGDAGYMMGLLVDPICRGKGIGTAIIRASESKLSELGCTIVAALLSPQATEIRLLDRLGYKTGLKMWAYVK